MSVHVDCVTFYIIILLLSKKVSKDGGEVLKDCSSIFLFDRGKDVCEFLFYDMRCFIECFFAFISKRDDMLAPILLVFGPGQIIVIDKRGDVPGYGCFCQIELFGYLRLGYFAGMRAFESDQDHKLRKGEGLFLGKDLLEVLLNQEAHLVNGVHEILGEIMLIIANHGRHRRFHAYSIACGVKVSKLSIGINKRRPLVGGVLPFRLAKVCFADIGKLPDPEPLAVKHPAQGVHCKKLGLG
jgi:hypothetical protein